MTDAGIGMRTKVLVHGVIDAGSQRLGIYADPLAACCFGFGHSLVQVALYELHILQGSRPIEKYSGTRQAGCHRRSAASEQVCDM